MGYRGRMQIVLADKFSPHPGLHELIVAEAAQCNRARAVNATLFAVTVEVAISLKLIELSVGSAPRFVPTMVTSALADTAGGLRKRMRGPPGFATCKPVSVPSPCWLGWVQTSEALRLGRWSAVNVQLLEKHGGRLRILPVRSWHPQRPLSHHPCNRCPRGVSATPAVPDGSSPLPKCRLPILAAYWSRSTSLPILRKGRQARCDWM